MSRGESLLLVALVGVSVTVVALGALIPHRVGAELLVNLWVTLVLFAGLVVASRKADGLVSAPWHRTLVRGIGGFSALASISYVVQFAMDIIPGFPRLVAGEMLWIAASIPLVMVVCILMVNTPSAVRSRVLFEWAVTTISLVALSWSTTVRPALQLHVPILIDRIVSVALPVSCSCMILAGLLLVTTGLRFRAARMSLVGIGAGVGFSALGQLTRYLALENDNFSHIFLVAGGLLVCAGVVDFGSSSLQSDLDQSEFRSSVPPTLASLSAPYFVALAGFAAVAVRDVFAIDRLSAATMVVGTILFILVVARQVISLHENLQLWTQVAKFNHTLEETVRRRTGQLEALHGLSKAVGGSLDVDEMVHGTTRHATLALRADALVINLAPFAFMGYPKIGELVTHGGLEGNFWVLDQLNVLESPRHLVMETLHDPALGRKARTLMVPVESKGRNLGWIAAFRWEDHFEDADQSVLLSIGAELGTALENARLYEVARQMADIDPVSGLLNHRASQERVGTYFELAKESQSTLALLMIDVDNFKQFNDTYGHMAGDEVLKSIGKIVREAIRPQDVAGRYGSDEFMVLIPEGDAALAHELAARIYDRLADVGYPEPGTDRVIPYQVSIGAAAFPEAAKSRHELLYAADNAMLSAKKQNHQSVGKRNVRKPARAEGDNFDLLDSMVNAVDNKDYYTRAHSEDVTDLAVAIAMELGYSGEILRIIRMTGLLHDVGKIGIPDEILRKPGQLTDEEYAVMKQHPVVGAMIVASMPGMADMVSGVKHHHERFDGKGYPDSLAGEAIPFLGRLLAVPDAYSAMTTDRPYRRGMAREVAMERILAGAGTQFDPVIVQAFERVMARRSMSVDLPRAA